MALRSILSEIFRIGGSDDSDEQINSDSETLSWIHDWTKYCSEVLKIDSDPTSFDDENEWRDWIDTCVVEFCRIHKFVEKCKNL